jgi:hypothetical protein
MKNMYSVGELIDKLIIENIKIYRLRENLHKDGVSDEKYVESENKMNLVNENRGTVINFLNNKINDVISGEDQNSYFKDVKTYADDKKKRNK